MGLVILPTWITATEEFEFKREKLMREALVIAWEALNQCKDKCDNHSGIPAHAIDRIRKLGESE